MSTGLMPDDWWNGQDSWVGNRYALIEMGALSGETRTALVEAAGGSYWPLIRGTQQEHLIREGPWLMALSNAEEADWPGLQAMGCGLMAWIESALPEPALASQLAPAMTVLSPEGKAWLLRFYSPSIIQALHERATWSWHRDLFNGIERWWYRAQPGGWQYLDGLPDDGRRHDAWRLECDASLWDALTGNTEVMTLTAHFVSEMPELFGDICPCDRPGRVANALAAADEAQLLRPEDRRVYVYLWLEKGESFLHSDSMKHGIEQAACSAKTLLESLQTLEEH
ncbi:DUF4123 domain-containing protein [Halomonas koreensis]|uniref:DUF4123 domain-containing protein n=1 Tax=Halomonas koreensis TaxID=245385 RepID=A0ABU1G651_9GAMM|nr:DUF4123 domain-containing protein [Halomonas koreensis]MDR5868438.1 DUF4123 domain-containing protein [Halomonas koreensis]